MCLILFIHNDSGERGKKLKTIIEQNFQYIEIQIFKTFNSFKSRLEQFSIHSDKEIYIVLADSNRRLKELTPLIELMKDKRLVLILPDDSNVSLSKAHYFFPRFFTNMNDRYDDLCAVLSKMIDQHTKKSTTL